MVAGRTFWNFSVPRCAILQSCHSPDYPESGAYRLPVLFNFPKLAFDISLIFGLNIRLFQTG